MYMNPLFSPRPGKAIRHVRTSQLNVKSRFTRQLKPSKDVNVVLVTETIIRTAGFSVVFEACNLEASNAAWK